MYHGRSAADAAAGHFTQVCRHRALPAEMPVVRLRRSQWGPDGACNAVRLLMAVGLAGSNSEARRLILEGGVRLDLRKVKDPFGAVEPRDGMIVQVGRRRSVRLTLEEV